MNLDLFIGTAQTQKEIVINALQEDPPQSPGVYTMYNQKGEVLYVGKAKNLNQRLYSYRYSKSKKTQRLLAHLHRIAVEVCKFEADAVLLENLLIRSLRPPFNRFNKNPETYYYIATNRSGNGRELRLSMKILDDFSKNYGCFKGHVRVRKGFGALLKLLYLCDEPIRSAHYFPALLLKNLAPMRFKVNMDDETRKKLDIFLAGKSMEIVEDFKSIVSSIPFKDTFTKKYLENEIDQLKQFFEFGPKRNQTIKKALDLESVLIGQQNLDDFLVLSKGG